MHQQSVHFKTPLYGFRIDHSGRGPIEPLPACPAPEVAWLQHWPQQKPSLAQLPSAFGPAVVCHDADTLYALHFAGEALAEAVAALEGRSCHGHAAQAVHWVNAWERQQAPPGKLAAIGTPFQHRVWQQLLRIPRGWLTTYGAIATAIGQPTAARAVGNAVGKNPLGGWIPCHRVLPAAGLGHYHWGGAAVKQALLQAEGVMATP